MTTITNLENDEELHQALETIEEPKPTIIGILHQDRQEIFFTENKEDYRIMTVDLNGQDLTAESYPQISGAEVYERINQYIREFEGQNLDKPNPDCPYEYRIIRPRTLDIFVIKRINLDPEKEYKCTVCLDAFQDEPKYTKFRKLRCQHKIHRYCSDFWFSVCKDQQIPWTQCPNCTSNSMNLIRYAAFVKH